MEITGNYNNYAGIYEEQRRQETAQTEAGGVGGEKETDAGGVYDKYINRLQKYAPDMKVRAGRGILTGRGKNPCTLTIHPDILEKIKNDPEKERYYADRLKDIERAEKLARSVTGADGFTTEYSHWYIDKDGKIWHTARTVRRDKLNEKLRREAQENAEKHIEATREKARGKAEELEKLAPSVKFCIGNSFSAARRGQTLTVNPKLLEEMQNNPEKAKKVRELVRGVEMMTKLVEGLNRASGWRTVYRHSYIDENGQYRHVAMTVNEGGYKMSAELREERKKKAEELLERTKEKAADRKEALQEMLEKAAEEMSPEKQAEPSDDSGEGGRFDMRI